MEDSCCACGEASGNRGGPGRHPGTGRQTVAPAAPRATPSVAPHRQAPAAAHLLQVALGLASQSLGSTVSLFRRAASDVHGSSPETTLDALEAAETQMNDALRRTRLSLSLASSLAATEQTSGLGSVAAVRDTLARLDAQEAELQALLSWLQSPPSTAAPLAAVDWWQRARASSSESDSEADGSGEAEVSSARTTCSPSCADLSSMLLG